MRTNLMFCTLAFTMFLTSNCKKAELENAIAVSDSVPVITYASVKSAAVDYGTFTIKNAVGGKFMEVSGDATKNEKFKNNASIAQWEATLGLGDLWQKWQIAYVSTVNGVKYYTLMNLHSGKVLDVPAGASTQGLQLQQYTNFGGDQELWELRSVGTTGNYNIINKKTGLAVTNLNGSTANGSAIVQQSLATGLSSNLALNRPVTVSSTENTTLVASYAVDGNTNTRWGSVYSDPQWLYVDLGVVYDINRVKITWEAAYASDYQIQISTDASAWTSIKTITGNTALTNEHNGLSGKGRYVRIYGTKRGSSWGYSIIELEINSNMSNQGSQQWLLTSIAADSYRDDKVVQFFERNSTSLGSVAFDEGTSIPLTWSTNNGKVLWVTQDAWDGTSLQSNGMFPCNYFFSYNNSMFLQPSITDWSPTAPNITINSPMGRPKQICSNQSGTDWSWPGPGVEIGDKVYVHCGEGVGLSMTNQSLYVLTQSTGTLWTSQRTTPAGLSGQTAIGYAAGMVKSGSYVYVYGCQGTGFGYTNNLHVARFSTSNPQAWTFWNGSSWVSSPVTGDAARVGDGLGTIAISYVNGKYVLLTMDQGFNCDATRNIYIATATSPTGPFTARTQVYSIKEYLGGQYARYYTPAIHPEFTNGRNELLITYCLNYSACGVDPCNNGYIDPYFYRVKGVRVPYSKIGL